MNNQVTLIAAWYLLVVPGTTRQYPMLINLLASSYKSIIYLFLKNLSHSFPVVGLHLISLNKCNCFDMIVQTRLKKFAIKFLFMWMQNFFVVTTMKNFKVVGVFLEQYQSLFFILISFENLADGLFNVIVALSLLFVDCFFSKQT